MGAHFLHPTSVYYVQVCSAFIRNFTPYHHSHLHICLFLQCYSLVWFSGLSPDSNISTTSTLVKSNLFSSVNRTVLRWPSRMHILRREQCNLERVAIPISPPPPTLLRPINPNPTESVSILFKYNALKNLRSNKQYGGAHYPASEWKCRQQLFPKTLPLKWICCCTEYSMSRAQLFKANGVVS